jgi:hypothetical protein
VAVPDHGKIAAETNYIQKYKKYAQHTLVGSSAVHRHFLPNQGVVRMERKTGLKDG